MAMEQPSPKLKVNMNTYRRLKIQHKINEINLKKNHLLNLQRYKYREERFHRLRQNLCTNNQPTILTNNHLLIPSSKSISPHHQTDLEFSQQILNERKAILLKQFEELKHTINDPNSTLSTLAALSRALFYLDFEKK